MNALNLQQRPVRRVDWQTRLTALVVQRMDMPFMWGSNDCVTFAMDAVAWMTGARVLEGVKPWSTAKEAYRALRPYGGLQAAVRELGLPEIDARCAQRGDLVLLSPPQRPDSMRGALAVCLGERVAAPGRGGLAMANLGQGACAWRV